MNRAKLFGAIALGILFMLNVVAAAEAGGRQRQCIDADWKFHRGDAGGAQQPEFDAAAWRTVSLPHDWSIEPDPAAKGPGFDGIFNQTYAAGSGYLPGGIGWYRKIIDLPAADQNKRVFVEFDGVYMNSDVWINGRPLGNRPYGYIGFEYELTPYLKFGQPNVLAVRADVEQPCSRWFSGAGIYRHVWLTVTDPVHIAHWGVTITTPRIARESADVQLLVRILNQAPPDAPMAQPSVRLTVLDPQGQEVGQTQSLIQFGPDRTATVHPKLLVPTPRLWSLDSPSLYTARVEVLTGTEVRDVVDTPFGIRTIEFTKDRGFLLNGVRVPIRGVCDHHDQGYLGSAAYDRAIERQLEILKSMGCNAIRTSHNPPAPKLLEVCDRLGFVVMDEAFDEWKHGKTQLGYGRFFDQWSEKDIRDMVRRDRNHPSVVLWSIGNEILEQSDPVQGPKQAHRLAGFCRDEDPTRFITSACSRAVNAVKYGYADALDVLGINYSPDLYPKWKGQRALIASETSSTVSTRGEYNLVLKDGKVAIEQLLNTQCTSYDVYRPPWAVQVEAQLKAIQDNPYIAGEFVWTGFDYGGEPTPFGWPAVSSYFGIVDLCGFPKDRFYLYQSRWTDKPMVHLLPHWNWPQFAGKAIPVWCYSNAESVELFLNGKSLGPKRMSDAKPTKYDIDFPAGRKGKKGPSTVQVEDGWLHQEWSVSYEPGSLKAVARIGGRVVATDAVFTAGPPARLAVEADRSDIAADGEDLAYITVKVLDADGHLCPDADNLVKFDVAGPGTLAAVGNGNPISHEPYQTDHRKAFHGLCLAILKAAKEGGEIRLTASSDGLGGGSIIVRTKP